jgi:hypothetical protein
MLEDRCLIAANRLDCSHRDPCDRRKRRLETSSQLPLPSNNDPVCCFLPERTAMVQNFMTRDTWTGDVDETVSVHNRSDPSVGDLKCLHMQSSATRQAVPFRSHAFFPFSSAGHGFPLQASRQAKRWWFQTKKEPLPSSRKILCRLACCADCADLDCCGTWVV